MTNRSTLKQTMRKLALTATAMLALVFVTYGQMPMTSQLQCMNTGQLCAGFGLENRALVRLSAPPIPVASNTVLNYTWTVEHANGTWVWHTNQSERQIPLPFVGTYTVQVKIEYVRKTVNRPYAAFWSSKLYITAQSCN